MTKYQTNWKNRVRVLYPNRKIISLDEKLNNLVIKRKQTRRKFGHRTQNGKQLNYFLLGLYHLKEYQIDSSYSILREKSECTCMY